MKMLSLLILVLGILLSACVPQNTNPNWVFPDHPPAVLHQKTETTVSLVPDQVTEFARICEQLGASAWEQGVEELLHMYVNQAPLLQPVEASQDGGSPKMYLETGLAGPGRDGRCDPWLDSITGMVWQRTDFFSMLVPERRLGGVIDALQEDQTMGGMLSKAYVTLWGPALHQEPIPVLIVQQSSGLERGMTQIVGSGLITQVTATTAQMRILESTREIFPGDLFFQLQVRVEVLPMEGDLLPMGPGAGD